MASDSQKIPFMEGSSLAEGLRIRAVLGGGSLHAFQVDTGSVGILVPRTVLGPDYQDFDPSKDTTFGFVSSGKAYQGQWVQVPAVLGVPDAWDGYGDYPMTQIEVFAVDHPSSFSGGMLGIGFDIGNNADGGPCRNPLLHLTFQGNALSQALIIGAGGIDVGIDSDVAGFQSVSLTRTSDDSDWAKPVGMLSLPGGFTKDLPILIDTGVREIILWVRPDARPPGSPDGLTLPSGANVTISIPSQDSGDAPALGYGFVAGDATDPMAPSEVEWRDGPGSVNTGRNLLASFNYLYDGAAGRVGFRALQQV